MWRKIAKDKNLGTVIASPYICADVKYYVKKDFTHLTKFTRTWIGFTLIYGELHQVLMEFLFGVREFVGDEYTILDRWNKIYFNVPTEEVTDEKPIKKQLVQIEDF